jgi:hypothetical protein
MANLAKLKSLIDESNFPYFEDIYLQIRIDEAGESLDLQALAKELCLVKAGIEEMKLGDITIPSPRKHFLALAQMYRGNLTGVVVRADGRK